LTLAVTRMGRRESEMRFSQFKKTIRETLYRKYIY
jgi:hypothetical protein